MISPLWQKAASISHDNSGTVTRVSCGGSSGPIRPRPSDYGRFLNALTNWSSSS